MAVRKGMENQTQRGKGQRQENENEEVNETWTDQGQLARQSELNERQFTKAIDQQLDRSCGRGIDACIFISRVTNHLPDQTDTAQSKTEMENSAPERKQNEQSWEIALQTLRNET